MPSDEGEGAGDEEAAEAQEGEESEDDAEEADEELTESDNAALVPPALVPRRISGKATPTAAKSVAAKPKA
eukprot:12695172-Heterocapsa_arctica.AAC.1